MPDELKPGVTYRDIEGRWRLSARLEDPPDTDAEPRCGGASGYAPSRAKAQSIGTI